MATEETADDDWFGDGESVSRLKGLAFQAVCLGATLFGIIMVFILIAYVFADAFSLLKPDGPWLTVDFLTSAHSRFPEKAGIYPALVGSIFMLVVVAAFAFPVGVGAAIYLEEYAPQNRYTRLIQINIANLAGVPSVVYGLLGLGVFVLTFQMPAGIVLVGGITIGLLILPIVIISAQEAIRAVPDSMRQASYGMGATKGQTIRRVVLPEALPGIMTGTILALGRAIGETAPLLMIGAPTTIYRAPGNFDINDPVASMLRAPGGFFDKFSAMPRQIYAWADLPQEEFQYGVLAAGVVTLLVVLLTMNATAILIRNKYQRRQ